MNTAEKMAWNNDRSFKENGETIVAGDGQVSLGNTVLKSKAKKVRKIEKRDVIAGFAGSTADALTLFERLEAKLEKHAGNLQRCSRACKRLEVRQIFKTLGSTNGCGR